MAEDKKTQLHSVDLVGIGNLLEDLIVKDIITCEERDRIIQRIVADNNFPDYKLSILAGYKRSKDKVLERAAQKTFNAPQYHKPDESYISLTELVRAHSDDAPGYVIQSWVRNGNTLVFLNLGKRKITLITVRKVTKNCLIKRKLHPLR